MHWIDAAEYLIAKACETITEPRTRPEVGLEKEQMFYYNNTQICPLLRLSRPFSLKSEIGNQKLDIPASPVLSGEELNWI